MRNGMKIGLTGGSGFLGSHLLPMLLERGAIVDALLRPGSTIESKADSLKIVPGDCLSGKGLIELAAGKDALIHMAFLLFGAGWQNYLQTNIRACQNLLEAIAALPAEKQPKKIIFVSSLAAAGPCALSAGRSETEKASPVSAYGWSKLLCEELFLAGPVKNVIILRPAIIYGSGDKGLLPMFRAAGKGLGISPGFGRKFPVSAIHAADAGQAIILACEKPAHGIYHLDDGKPYDMDILCQAMAQAQERSGCRMLHIPLPVMGAGAASCEMAATLAKSLLPSRFGNFAPKWNMDKFREARQAGWLSNSERIRNELGFSAEISLPEGMAEAVQGYRSRGML